MSSPQLPVHGCVIAQIHHLGLFAAEADAARAYDRAVVELRGPGAQTNFVTGDGEAPAAEPCGRSAGTALETPEQLIARVVAAALAVAASSQARCGPWQQASAVQC